MISSPSQGNRSRIVAGLAALLALVASGTVCRAVDLSQLDRGHRLLLQYGYQLHGAVGYAVDLDVWRNAHFNGLNFESTVWQNVMGWANPPISATNPYYVSGWSMRALADNHPNHWNLRIASVIDEVDLSNHTNVTNAAQYLADFRSLEPNVIGLGTDDRNQSMTDIQYYMAHAQPDMLLWDYYAFSGSWAGGSPTGLYNGMGKYRTAGLAGNSGDGAKPIPYGMWYQAYKKSGYVLSESEMNVQFGAAWAYGYKSLFAWTYGVGINQDPPNATVLFSSSNDANPTPLYTTVANRNRDTQILAPSLLRLKSTDLRFVRGKHGSGSGTTNTLPGYAGDWSSSNDPYMTGITATNLGSTNNGLRGDVIVGYFQPLLEDFDGPNFSNQVYFMITNGLTAPGGTSVTNPNMNAFDTRQLVHLTFNFGASGINSLQELDRATGQVVTVPLVHDGGSSYHLDWYLLGGEGDLFKYNTGAPFITPEPSALVLLGTGAVALAAYAWRKRR